MKIDFTDRMQKSKSVDEAYSLMFSSNLTDEQIRLLPIKDLYDYPDQPFRPYSEKRLGELAEDIRQNGILSPLRVRAYKDGFQILSGHNRRNAAELAGFAEVPCIITENIDDDTAALIVVNTNLNQRDELLPSEKAFAYKMQLEAMRHKAGRPTKNFGQLGQNFQGGNSREELADQTGESSRQIQRYIRITYLLPEFLQMVDSRTLPFMAGVSLSYHHEIMQQRILDFMKANKIRRITLKQSEEISKETDLTDELLSKVFGFVDQQPKAARKTGNATINKIESFFSKSTYSDKEIAEIVEIALSLWEEKEHNEQ